MNQFPNKIPNNPKKKGLAIKGGVKAKKGAKKGASIKGGKAKKGSLTKRGEGEGGRGGGGGVKKELPIKRGERREANKVPPISRGEGGGEGWGASIKGGGRSRGSE